MEVLGTAVVPAPIVVGLDAGHGGVDSGKVGVNNLLEKEINLIIADRVRQKLEEQGIVVVMSRKDDDGLYLETDSNKKQADLKKRCQIFDDAKCEIVVSIHQNSYHEENASGPQVFYYTTSEKGKILAEQIQEKMVTELKPQSKRAAKANDSYYLLRKVSCPIVIVECGFLSNWQEATMLGDESYQEAVAQAVCDGILDYLQKNGQ
jgi:N-acetylmuramoyl-L-alanine amidase